uniref:Complement C6 n=1 Tax=Poecilia formosa TaxID=48698 RepID=A0A096MB53_POEFO
RKLSLSFCSVALFLLYRKYDTRGCNQQACPINCVLSEFSRWSDCSPCARKQFRTRSVVRPSQFGGSECSVELTEERPCHPSKDCQLPAVGCRGDFKCDNGRCINSTLTCNKQNDCGDNSDERGCGAPTVVCPSERRPAPGADLVGNGFDFLAEEPRGAVLDNMFMGGSCIIRRPQSTLLYHRVPHNFKTFDIKVVIDNVVIKKSGQSEQNTRDQDSFQFLFFYGRRSSSSSLTSSKDSKFFRVHQLLPISNFTVKDPQDLVLSLPFLQFLHALPLDYNYALYREIFQRFGTHYYSSGKLGGLYDLLYQYSREEIKSSEKTNTVYAGETEETINGCLSRDTSWTIILYSESSSVTRCTNNRMTEKYQVKGGGAREAGALSWERQGAAPDKTSYKNWAKSVIDNPALVDYQLRPIIDLVRGIPCAVTKRRHLRKALLQYLEEFDTCKCAPCPNNAKPVLSGTECKCVCQTGTFGTNCEEGCLFSTEVVDGYWSCWGPWSSCSASMRRHRTRKCDNPAPLRGGQPCDGPNRQEEPCPLSLFEKKESCDNDDEFTVGWRDELPPGVEGCLRPQRPSHSFLRKSKQYYSFGEDEEFQCFTGFELEGFQFINCQPDGTWSQPRGRCIRRLCVAPEVPENMELYPPKATYRVGESVGFNCNETGLMPMPRGIYRCSRKLTWEPPLPADLRCTDGWSSLHVPCDLDSCYDWETCSASKKCQCKAALDCPRTSDLMFCVKLKPMQMIRSMSLCTLAAITCSGREHEILNEGVCQ